MRLGHTRFAAADEADETYLLRSSKSQHVQARKARHRGGSGAKRGLSDEQEPVLVARDRSGAAADFISHRAGKAQTIAVLTPVLAPDAAVHGLQRLARSGSQTSGR